MFGVYGWTNDDFHPSPSDSKRGSGVITRKTMCLTDRCILRHVCMWRQLLHILNTFLMYLLPHFFLGKLISTACTLQWHQGDGCFYTVCIFHTRTRLGRDRRKHLRWSRRTCQSERAVINYSYTTVTWILIKKNKERAMRLDEGGDGNYASGVGFFPQVRFWMAGTKPNVWQLLCIISWRASLILQSGVCK